jgi:uncharacterized protein YggU (UPF0235/DUF167 family)
MKIFIIAKTNAKEESVEKIDKYNFIIQTKELPIKGRANLAIIKMLADYYKIPKTDVTISSGFKSKNKIFDISLT